MYTPSKKNLQIVYIIFVFPKLKNQNLYVVVMKKILRICFFPLPPLPTGGKIWTYDSVDGGWHVVRRVARYNCPASPPLNVQLRLHRQIRQRRQVNSLLTQLLRAWTFFLLASLNLWPFLHSRFTKNCILICKRRITRHDSSLVGRRWIWKLIWPS